MGQELGMEAMFGLTKTARPDCMVSRAFDLGTGASGSDVQSDCVMGLVAGTKVATTAGWRQVEMVKAGDKVLTFDAGLQRVAHVTREKLWSQGRCPQQMWPLFVPEGALGNQQPMMVLPQQPLMIESDVTEEVYGDPFVLIPAAALDGYRGIERIEPEVEIEVVTLHFEHDQVIFTAPGALYFCASQATAADFDPEQGLNGDYNVLSIADADYMIGCMELEQTRPAQEEEHSEAALQMA